MLYDVTHFYSSDTQSWSKIEDVLVQSIARSSVFSRYSWGNSGATFGPTSKLCFVGHKLHCAYQTHPTHFSHERMIIKRLVKLMLDMCADVSAYSRSGFQLPEYPSPTVLQLGDVWNMSSRVPSCPVLQNPFKLFPRRTRPRSLWKRQICAGKTFGNCDQIRKYSIEM